MDESKICISSFIKNANEKQSGNNINVPFSNWKAAVDKMRDEQNAAFKYNAMHKSLIFKALFSMAA